jgi:putative hydrolase of the HAD superfamily
VSGRKLILPVASLIEAGFYRAGGRGSAEPGRRLAAQWLLVPLLLCDLDDTLIDRAGAFRRWAADFLRRHDLPDDELPWMLDLDDDGYVNRPAYLAAVRERFGVGVTPRQMVDDYYERYPAFVEPAHPDTLAALRDLRGAGWRVGVVTNGAPSQEAKLTHAGIRDLLDGWAISDVVGQRKPHPAIFRAAAERCRHPLAGAWVVGDHGPADIAGASALGLRSVWLRRGREWAFQAYRPTHVADTFAEAARLVAIEGRGSRPARSVVG